MDRYQQRYGDFNDLVGSETRRSSSSERRTNVANTAAGAAMAPTSFTTATTTRISNNSEAFNSSDSSPMTMSGARSDRVESRRHQSEAIASGGGSHYGREMSPFSSTFVGAGNMRRSITPSSGAMTLEAALQQRQQRAPLLPSPAGTDNSFGVDMTGGGSVNNQRHRHHHHQQRPSVEWGQSYDRWFLAKVAAIERHPLMARRVRPFCDTMAHIGEKLWQVLCVVGRAYCAALSPLQHAIVAFCGLAVVTCLFIAYCMDSTLLAAFTVPAFHHGWNLKRKAKGCRKAAFYYGLLAVVAMVFPRVCAVMMGRVSHCVRRLRGKIIERRVRDKRRQYDDDLGNNDGRELMAKTSGLFSNSGRFGSGGSTASSNNGSRNRSGSSLGGIVLTNASTTTTMHSSIVTLNSNTGLLPNSSGVGGSSLVDLSQQRDQYHNTQQQPNVIHFGNGAWDRNGNAIVEPPSLFSSVGGGGFAAGGGGSNSNNVPLRRTISNSINPTVVGGGGFSGGIAATNRVSPAPSSNGSSNNNDSSRMSPLPNGTAVMPNSNPPAASAVSTAAAAPTNAGGFRTFALPPTPQMPRFPLPPDGFAVKRTSTQKTI